MTTNQDSNHDTAVVLRKASQALGARVSRAIRSATESQFAAAATMCLERRFNLAEQNAFLKRETAIAVAKLRRDKTSTERMLSNERNRVKAVIKAGIALFEKHSHEMLALASMQNDSTLIVPILTEWLESRYPTTGHVDEALRKPVQTLSDRAKMARAVASLWRAANAAQDNAALRDVAGFLTDKARLIEQYENQALSREQYESGLATMATCAKESAATWSALADGGADAIADEGEGDGEGEGEGEGETETETEMDQAA